MHSSCSVEDIYQSVLSLADQGRDLLLAVVLKADGSTPGRAGAKAVVADDGVIQGTVGGGLVEAEVQRRAAEIIERGHPVVVDFNLDSRGTGAVDPICGGAMRVLMDPTAIRHREAYAIASTIRDRRQRGALLTTIRGRTKREVTVRCLAEQAVASDLGFPGAQAVRSALTREEPRLFVSDSTLEEKQFEVLVEPVIPQPVIVVVGGGHVGQAVAAQAALVEFDLVVIDDRPEFTRPNLFPDGVTMRCGSIEEELAAMPLDGNTFIVIVTRGHKHDAEALTACIHEPVAYIGMIGSGRKVAMVRTDFIESGQATSKDFDRVYAPIGLDIGSVTVSEIAASIVAQVIAVRRKGISPRIPTT
jgi:xanthine dehydrogenase accessory factor